MKPFYYSFRLMLLVSCGYNHAWCNNNGEYIMTDNPNFNPNEGSNLHWETLKRK